LRQQLIILRGTTNTPRLTGPEQWSLVFLTHWVPNWKQILQITQPDTLLRWHPHSPAPASGAGVRAGQVSRRFSMVLAGFCG
jgi:hypothetical protein